MEILIFFYCQSISLLKRISTGASFLHSVFHVVFPNVLTPLSALVSTTNLEYKTETEGGIREPLDRKCGKHVEGVIELFFWSSCLNRLGSTSNREHTVCGLSVGCDTRNAGESEWEVRGTHCLNRRWTFQPPKLGCPLSGLPLCRLQTGRPVTEYPDHHSLTRQAPLWPAIIWAPLLGGTEQLSFHILYILDSNWIRLGTKKKINASVFHRQGNDDWFTRFT